MIKSAIKSVKRARENVVRAIGLVKCVRIDVKGTRRNDKSTKFFSKELKDLLYALQKHVFLNLRENLQEKVKIVW